MANTFPAGGAGPRARVLALVDELKTALAAAGLPVVEGLLAPAVELPGPSRQLVTLDQIAAFVHLSKRSLERHKKRMPPPVRRGGGGNAALWDWSEVRAWVEKTFAVVTSPRFPR